MKKIIIAAAAWSLIAAVAAGSAGQKADPEVLLKERRIVDPSPGGFTLDFQLILRNPTAAPLLLSRYDYKVVIDETGYFDLQIDLAEPLPVPARGETLIALPVKLNYANLFPAVPGLKDKDLAFCYVSGGMTFRDERRKEKRVPMAFSSDFPVFRGLEFEPAPIEAESLTIGGAEIVAGVVLRNPNGFSFTIDKWTYRLSLVGRPVAEGAGGEGTKIAARGEATLSFPVTIDFYEIGRMVYDGLAQPPTDARAAGEVEITTPWGPWRISYDRSAKVAVRKRRP
jgi:LEA14-like dessication related protein